jgi:hypothetical protein
MNDSGVNPIGSDSVFCRGSKKGPSREEIARRLVVLADEMDSIAVAMDYYGGFSAWAQHGLEIAGAGRIARQWAAEILAA